MRNQNNSVILTSNNFKQRREPAEYQQKSLKMQLNKNSNKILENIRRLNCSGQNTYETSRNRSREPPNKRKKNKSQKNLMYGDYRYSGLNDDYEYQTSDVNNYHTINNPNEHFHQSSISWSNNVDMRKFDIDRSKSPGKHLTKPNWV